MKKLLHVFVLASIIICLSGCDWLFPDTLEPPMWLWGTWEGSWTKVYNDGTEGIVKEVWKFSEKSIVKGAEGQYAQGDMGELQGTRRKDFYDSQYVYRLGLQGSTSAIPTYTFERIDESTVKLTISSHITPEVYGETTLTKIE